MPQVTLGPNFFKKERKQAYPNWKLEISRELFQNSDGAGSTSINVEVREDGDLTYMLFEDNGCGMSIDVLNNVYFRLGETTKAASDTGGFGRARILTNFSVEKYVITTQDHRVEGSGDSYEIFKAPQFFKGCRQEIWESDATPQELLSGLKQFLGMCNTELDITINGEKFNSPYDRGTWIRNLERDGKVFARVYLSKGGSPGCVRQNRVVVRVNGNAMFENYSYPDHQITVELVPETSKEILTSTRSSLMTPYNSYLQGFVNELSTETTSALKVKRQPFLKVFQGTGMFTSRKKREQGERSEVFRDELKVYNESIPVALRALSGSSVGTLSGSAGFYSSGGDPEAYDDGKMSYERTDVKSSLGKVLRVSDFIPHVPVIVDTDEEVMHRVSEWYVPEAWEFVLKGDKVDWGKWKSYVNLLLALRISAEEAVEAYMEIYPQSELSWCVGFVFGDPLGRQMELDGGYAFMINPVDEFGRMRYDPKKPEGLRAIQAIMKHEVAHVRSERHDEAFSTALTNIDIRYDAGRAESAFKRVRI